MNWKDNAFRALDDARAEIDVSTGEAYVVVMVIGKSDLAAERPMSFFANIGRGALQSFLAFAAWRLSIPAPAPPEAPK